MAKRNRVKKIHFMGMPSGNKDHYQQIFIALEGLGYQVITKHILERTQAAVDAESTSEAKAYVKKSHKWIRQADIVVCEGSKTCTSLGFEICLALREFKKPVVVLYRANSQPILNSLQGLQIDSDKLQLLQYDDSSLWEDLKQALRLAARLSAVHFNLYISPEQAHYLTWHKRVKNKDKASVIQDLLQQDMEANEEYWKSIE